MSHRGYPWLLLPLSASVAAMTSACTGGDGEGRVPVESAVPREFAATFELQSPIAVVAGDGAAWVLTQLRHGDGLSVLRIDHTGRGIDDVRRPGTAVRMLPFLDGAVVARVACATQRCEETASSVLVVDRDGTFLAEEEFAREPGDLDDSTGGIKRNAVSGDTVWIDTPNGPGPGAPHQCSRPRERRQTSTRRLR